MLEFDEDIEPPTEEDMKGEIHVLLVGIDYSCDSQSWAGPPPTGHGPLDTKFAYQMMEELCAQCGVTSVTKLWNQQATRDGLKAAIQQVADKCGQDDHFIFYYTGHGDRLDDLDNAEADGKDEALCLVDAQGNTDDAQMQYRNEVWMRDDEFVETITNAFEGKGADLLFLFDCCHSSSMCDFDSNEHWKDSQLNAISLSGCQDDETSAGTGKGGYFTRSLTQAVQDLNTGDESHFWVAQVYNACVEEYKKHKKFAHTQHIQISYTGQDPVNIPWVLNPEGEYTAPANAAMITYGAPPAP